MGRQDFLRFLSVRFRCSKKSVFKCLAASVYLYSHEAMIKYIKGGILKFALACQIVAKYVVQLHD